MSRAGLQSICFVNGQTTCKGGGSGGEKKVFPLNTIKSSAVKLFSVPKAIYILDRWRNFLISRLSPHSPSIYQKIFPATSLIIPSLIICIISWVHYCQPTHRHTNTHTGSRGCQSSAWLFSKRVLQTWEDPSKQISLQKLKEYLYMSILLGYSLLLTFTSIPLSKIIFLFLHSNWVLGQRDTWMLFAIYSSTLGPCLVYDSGFYIIKKKVTAQDYREIY